MRDQRIRWPNVAKLAGGVGLGAALLFIVPALLEPPEPAPLAPDIGLAPDEQAPPEPGPIPSDVSATGRGGNDCARSGRRRAGERSSAPPRGRACNERDGSRSHPSGKRQASRDRGARRQSKPGRMNDAEKPAPVAGGPEQAPISPTPSPLPEPAPPVSVPAPRLPSHQPPPLIREFGL